MKRTLLKLACAFTCASFLLVGGLGILQSTSSNPNGQASSPAPAYAAIDPLLKQEMELRPGEKVRVIIELEDQLKPFTEVAAARMLAQESQLGLIALLQDLKASDIKQHWIINAISTKLPAGSIYEIATHPDVARIWLDKEISLIQPAIASPAEDYGDHIINAPAMWQQGFDGSGIRIAILDTGIDDTHPDLQGKVVAAKDFTDDGTVDDLHGHGTHCAGIAAGAYNPETGISGVAPGAYLINAKVLNREGESYFSWLLAGIEWSIEQNADIFSLSLGWPQEDGSGRDPVSRALTNAVAAGHVVITSAGNSGPGEATITAPATAYGIIAVAASDNLDAIAEWSSRGPTGDGRLGIDIAAPGVDIIAPNAFWEQEQDHISKSGTSMAAPHVAGAAALLLHAQQAFAVDVGTLLEPGHSPTLAPEVLEKALKNSADNLGHDILEQGTGRLDVKDAFDALTTGILVEDEWRAGRVIAPSIHTKSFTVTNNSEEDVFLEITSSNLLDTQGYLNALLLDVPPSLFIPAGGTATFDAQVTVLDVARPGTAIGSITVGNITIPVSVSVMQYVDVTRIELWGIVDEGAAPVPLPWLDFPRGDWIYYALDVQTGVDQLNVSLAWDSPLLNDLDLYLFNPQGELAVPPLGGHPERASIYFPAFGIWTVAINASALAVTPVGYTLTIETGVGRTIYVPDDYPTIQGAVDAANSGDTIIVREGTYTENIDVTKSLIIKSESGPDLTIVQAASRNDHVFHIKEVDNVRISGFTVRGATGDRRAGIALERASYSEIFNNICSGNWVGIGLFLSHENIIRNNTLSNNRYGIGISEDEAACAVKEAVYRAEITAVPEGILNSLRNFRDRELNPGYVNLFYKYSPEVTQILIEEPALLIESARLILKYIPAVRYLIGEGGNDLEITEEDVRRVVSFIRNLTGEISEREKNIGAARSSAIIRLLKEFIDQVEASEGQTFTQAFRNSVYYTGNEKVVEPLAAAHGHNIIFLNNFIDNEDNARLDEATATWRSPEPITYIFNNQTFTSYLGNHWCDYRGSDADGDGIGDTSHIINGDKDYHPLMERFENYLPRPVEPKRISAVIDHYTVSPRNVIVDGVDDKVTIGFRFTNTGNIAHTFGAGATLRSPDGQRITFLESVTVAPGRWGSARWTATIDRPGRWDVVFGVWEQATHPLRDLLDQTGWVAEYITATEDPAPLPVLRFLTLPFRDADIKIQQGWIYTWDPDPGAHKGIDYIKGEIDQPPWQSFDVVAAADGRAIRGSSPSWGTYVYIRHYERAICGNNYHTLYAHLESVNPKISDTEWTPVRRGEFIGRAGATGVKDRYGNPQPTWIHLHFEVHIGDARPREKAYNRIDPYDLYTTREYYPGGQKYTRSGQNHLWTSDPPTQAPAAHPVITSPLEITPLKEFYRAKEDLTAQFTIANKGTDPITFNVLVVGGRGPTGEIVDFDKSYNITLNPGGGYYNYQGSLTLPDRLGEYYFFIAYQTPDGKWHSNIDVKIDGEIVEGAEAINFRVRHILVADAIIKAPPPPALWHEISGPWDEDTWLVSKSLSHIAVHPNNPQVIYAVVRHYCPFLGGIFGDRLYKSTDGGDRWEPINKGLPRYTLHPEYYWPIGAIAIAPSNPNVIYVGTSVGRPYFEYLLGRGIFRSTEGGGNWVAVGGPYVGGLEVLHYPVSSLIVHPTNPNIVYAGTTPRGGIWRTEDGGGSWERVWHKGIVGIRYYSISALAISPVYPHVIYAAAYTALSPAEFIVQILAAWKKGGFAITPPQAVLIKSESGDIGTWQELSLEGWYTPKIDDIAISKKNPSVVYVVTTALNVYWTSDRGNTWHSAGTPVDIFLPKQPSLLGRDVPGHSIALHPLADVYGPIYVGNAGGSMGPAGGVYRGVYCSVLGEEWFVTERKQPTSELVFASDANSLILYAAGPDGLWAIDLTKGQMVIRHLSPGELRVYDSQGRVTGLVDGVVKQEIPHSVYDAENKTVTILSPIDTYRFVVAGIEEGEFGLMIALADDRKVAPFSVADIPTSAYTTHQFTIDWDLLAQEDRGATVEIDADGDGVFEEKIELQLPRPSFIYSPVSPTVGQIITFDASHSYDPDGSIISYRWDFGDGVTEAGKTASHSFLWAGNYRVTLSVTDNDGVVNSFYAMVTVTEPPEEPPGEVVMFPDRNLEVAIREALGIGPHENIYQSDLKGLTTLSASDRGISDLIGLEYAVNLTDLSLPGNQITDISPLSDLANLGVLFLGRNLITDITPLANLTKLSLLCLGYNQIAHIEPLVQNEGLSQTDFIDLRGNPLSPESQATYLPQLKARGVEVLYDPPMPGDVNFDGRVDTADLAIIAAAMNTKEGTPNWNPAADLNQDGIVDIFDLVLVGRNFGGGNE